MHILLLVVYVLVDTPMQFSLYHADIIDYRICFVWQVAVDLMLLCAYFHFLRKVRNILKFKGTKMRQHRVSMVLSISVTVYMLVDIAWDIGLLVCGMVRSYYEQPCQPFLRPLLLSRWYFHQVGTLLQSFFVLQVLSFINTFVHVVLDFDFAEDPLEKLTNEDDLKMDQSLETYSSIPETKYSLKVRDSMAFQQAQHDGKKSFDKTDRRMKSIRKHKAKFFNSFLSAS